MEKLQLESLRRQVTTIARSAGAAIMAVYRDDFTVELKDDHSPLTAADRAAHTVIVTQLAALAEDIPILSEESSPTETKQRLDWSLYWLVDPLDGTKEFVKRNGEFTVNIALIDDHKPILGVVYAPVLDKMYSGIDGVGAWQCVAGETDTPINVTQPAADPLRVVGSRSHPSAALKDYLDWLGPHQIKAMGSSLKICLVAAGEADIYPRLGPTSEWDTAAAHAVLLGAGGSMIDPDGQQLRYNKGESLLNPHFFACGDPNRRFFP